jgi:nitrous oxide reductase accessory protein NosL
MKIAIYFIGIYILFLVSCTSQSTENQSDKSITKHEPTCQHCGMLVNKAPQWKASLTTSEKQNLWFCSPRCLLIKVKDPKSPYQKFQSIFVNDYYEAKPIAAEQAFYVIKSDVLGPMGNDLIPFRDLAAAEDFKKDHQGQKILTFKEITLQIIKEASE